MALATRLTQRLALKHPIIQAPMAFAAGGRLAAAVSAAGALGLIGGGYGDAGWLEPHLREAGNARVGCGFITWSLRQHPEVLDMVLSHRPAAIFLSFDDPGSLAPQVKAAGVPLFCQVQSRRDAELAIDAGADVIVAQGGEAGGHAGSRATMTLVPEVADLIAQRARDTLLCAAGGIADGRGLAAALALGADGAVVGTRLWASQEAIVHRGVLDAGIAATGDDTLKTSVTDIIRRYPWPERFSIRVVANDFTRRWHGREAELEANLDAEAKRYGEAAERGDATTAGIIAGESIGLVNTIEPAAAIIERMVGEAERILARNAALVR